MHRDTRCAPTVPLRYGVAGGSVTRCRSPTTVIHSWFTLCGPPPMAVGTEGGTATATSPMCCSSHLSSILAPMGATGLPLERMEQQVCGAS